MRQFTKSSPNRFLPFILKEGTPTIRAPATTINLPSKKKGKKKVELQLLVLLLLNKKEREKEQTIWNGGGFHIVDVEWSVCDISIITLDAIRTLTNEQNKKGSLLYSTFAFHTQKFLFASASSKRKRLIGLASKRRRRWRRRRR